MDTKELQYYKKKVDDLAGEIIMMQYNIASMSNQITQLQNGFQSMVHVMSKFYRNKDTKHLFEYTAELLTRKLYLDNCLFLKRSAATGNFVRLSAANQQINIPEEVVFSKALSEKIQNDELLVVNAGSERDEWTEELARVIAVPFFICRPFYLLNEQYLLLGGRKNEHKRFTYAPLSESDGFVFTAVGNLISNLCEISAREDQIERERSRIARDMHDNIGSELSNISLWSELMMRTAQESGSLYKDKIRGSIREVVENLGNTVWLLNSDNNSLADLCGYARAYAGAYLENHGIAYTQNDEMKLPDIHITYELRHNIFMIIKEALFNTVKYADASEVNIQIRHEEGLNILISDNGKGIQEARPFGNGIINMRKRCEELGGGV